MEATTVAPAGATNIEQLAQSVAEEFINCAEIDADFNYRRRYAAGPMQLLKDNITAVGGLIYPVIVRKKADGRYQLLVGGRRYRAVTELFGEDAPIKAKVLSLSDQEAVTIMMSENGARDDPSVIEDAEGASRMLGLCNGNRKEAAARLGWNDKKFERRLALMHATQKVRDAYLDGKIGVGVLELLAAMRREVQDRIIDRCEEANKWPTIEEFKTMAEKALCSLEAAIFSRTDCNGCQHNTGYQQTMFDHSFEGSRCTNKECYDKKTEAELEVRKAQLEETYQVVRIVRPGENHTLIPLRAEGNDKVPGVGQEQAKACRTCADFGACVSAVPDKLGQSFKDLCFNKACHDGKVAEERQRVAEANKPAEPPKGAEAAQEPQGQAQQQGAAGGGEKASQPTSPQARANPNAIRGVVKEHREAVWRAVFHRAALKLDVLKSRSLLVAVLLHRPSHVDNAAALEAINKAAGTKFGTGNKTERILKMVLEMGQDNLKLAFNELAANVKGEMAIEDLVGFLKALDVKLEDHWRLNDTFLNVLTKTEIDAVCEELGIDKAMGKTYVSLKNGSKKEFVEAVLKVSDFKYEGAVPKMMRWG